MATLEFICVEVCMGVMRLCIRTQWGFMYLKGVAHHNFAIVGNPNRSLSSNERSVVKHLWT